MADFGADASFAQAVKKIKEHYGIDLPTSAVREITLHHAETLLERELETQLPLTGIRQLIAELDGSMVPIVAFPLATSSDSPQDKRKQRGCHWKQARLVLVRNPSSVSKLYNATMGEAELAGEQLKDLARRAGAGHNTCLHGLGDGATWIVEQIEARFGERGSFLVDFYHVSQYLAQAAEAVAGANQREWLRKQQERMKQNRVEEVLAELQSKLENVTEEQKEALEKCERYLSNRLAYFDYEGAIQAGLPIGSGEVESGHRSVIQARLKLSGAWWKIENAEKMLALRVVRANGQWQSYWDKLRQAAA